MNRRTLLLVSAALLGLQACYGTALQKPNAHTRGVGIVVEHGLAPGAAVKKGVNAWTDNGYRLFGPAELNEKNGGTGQLGGGVIPRWVRVTWREGADTARGLHWTTGKVVGDYTVPVLDQIPPEAFELARAGRKQFLVLRFRLRDDGVEFGWMVRLQDGVPFQVLMRGGDF